MQKEKKQKVRMRSNKSPVRSNTRPKTSRLKQTVKRRRFSVSKHDDVRRLRTFSSELGILRTWKHETFDL